MLYVIKFTTCVCYYEYELLKLCNIIVYCINVYMYAYNVLLTNTCNMYEIKILLLYVQQFHVSSIYC